MTLWLTDPSAVGTRPVPLLAATAALLCSAQLAAPLWGQTPASALLTQHYDGNNGFNGNGWHSLALGDNGGWAVNYDRLYLRRADGTYTNQIKVSFSDHAAYLDTAGLYYQGGNVGVGMTDPAAALDLTTSKGPGSTANWYDPSNYAAHIHHHNNAPQRYGLLVSDY